MPTPFVAIVGVISFVASTGVAFAQAPSSPTYNKDVATILNDNCAMCHRPGEVAPMSLLSYKEVRPWARAIRTKVVTREMPPWFAEVRASHPLKNTRALTDTQIETIVRWVEAGAPEGTGTAPPPPEFAGDGQNAMGRPPDLIFESPAEIELPATGVIPPNFSLWSKSGLTSDTFVEAVELRPSNRAVTHHGGVNSNPRLPGPPGTTIGAGAAWKGGPMVSDGVLTLPDGRPLFVLQDVETTAGEIQAQGGDDASGTPRPLPVDPDTAQGRRRPRGATFGSILAAYGPGGGFFQYPAGIAKRMGATDYISWGMHYTNTGRPEFDRPSLLVWKPKTPPTHEAVSTLMDDTEVVNGKELLAPDSPMFAISGGTASTEWKIVRPTIQPHTDNFTVTSMTAFDSPVTLVTAWPHMHFRGKSMKFIAVYPDGREDTILNIPRYNFEWQLFYAWERPVKLPAGSVVRVETTYDNSVKNPLNPSPAAEVIWGSLSWNEMHFPFIEFVLDSRVKPWEQPDYREETRRPQAQQRRR